MHNKLYSQFGGGWTKSSKSHFYLRASWPLVNLSLEDDVLEYRFLKQRVTIPYSEIERVQIRFISNIVFNFKGDATDYAFAGLGLGKAVKILQSKGVEIDQDTLRDLKFAIVLNGILYFIFFAFLTVWLSMLMWVIILAILNS